MKPTKLDQLLNEDKAKKYDWKLTPNHRLVYKAEGEDEEFKLNSSLIAVEPDALVFSYTEKQSAKKTVTRILKLAGTWKLNPKNQITFEVERQKGKSNVLTFTGTWKVNDYHEIVYTYEERSLKTKLKKTQELCFKGYWDISDKHRLTYFVGGDSNNAFHFKGAFQTTSIYAKKGEIRYQIGVDIAGKPFDSAQGKNKIQTITLFGKWLLSKDLKLDFEIEYADKQKRTISFGGTYSLSDFADITVNLKSQTGKPLGIELILTKEIFNGDGNVFLRLQKSLEESRIEAGMKVVW